MMPNFDYFVVFAEMRTGSNFLEANLNAFPGIECHGEAFNPHFIGYPNRDEILGFTHAARESDPQGLIEAVKTRSDGIGGFRYFNDHDPRAYDIVMADPRCAKIVLTRNPVESYVSWKIAQATGQWKLTNVKHAKSGKVEFDAAEFETHLEALQQFQVRLLNDMQRSGQTAFYVAYEDLQDIDVMNGIAGWLGVEARLDGLDKKLKKQNPEPMSDKVTNFDDMERALVRLDRFNLARTPNFEPRRGAAIPGYIAAHQSPLLFLPVLGGPNGAVKRWMAALDGMEEQNLIDGFTQKTLRQWKRSHPGHRGFSVIRHPVQRIHAAFCEKIVPVGPTSFMEIRKTLRQVFKVPLPGQNPGDDYDAAAHRAAFVGFLGFVKANLGGQTGVRVDAWWATQTEVIQGMANFSLPDMVLREDDLPLGLGQLAEQIGRDDPPDLDAVTDENIDLLEAIYDEEIEGLVRDIYQRDYMGFGFSRWR
ncbi:nodulation protein NodH [Pelagovum pacificum]|uniref:Nodulation protein NodH n=1 Tax=Pelagovum pacificum TaxID=2588711 RepID=A0A5C5GID7_9RHOB|nr:nodulation protein NodH [Pelagovum pacificum]QQA42860.1 nodulation protein NodH [Pelagovum pacificum]TNY33994.1 nodulation protein NodH [Pelagovum pacificum]